MKILLAIAILLSSSCLKVSSSLQGDSEKEKILDVDVDNSNTTAFTIPLDINLPEQQIDFNISKATCNTKKGRFLQLEINGEQAKNLCLTKDSLQSSGTFLRLLMNYVSVLWGKFTFPSGSLDKNFIVKVKMGKYCAKPGTKTLCLNAMGGDASLGDESLLPLLELRSEVLSSELAKTTIKDLMDNDLVKNQLAKKLGGVKLTDSYKSIIAAASLNLVNAYLPEKFDISIYGFEALGNDEYSISIDLFLPSQWVKENGGEFSLPDVSSLAPLLKLNEGLVKSVSKVRLLLNHDCDAMVGSVYGDYNACIPKTKTTIKGTLKSKVLSDVTRGKYVEISVDPELNTYDSIAFDFTNLGIGLVKEVADNKKASCSWKQDTPYTCAFSMALNRFKYMDKADKVSFSFSSGVKTMLGKNPSGECKGRFVIRPNMTKYKRKNISYLSLLPPTKENAINRNFRVDVNCLTEIIGSCNCRANGKIRWCDKNCDSTKSQPLPPDHVPKKASCYDEPPPGKFYSCAQQASWNKCSKIWMKGYCKKSCGSCDTF